MMAIYRNLQHSFEEMELDVSLYSINQLLLLEKNGQRELVQKNCLFRMATKAQ